MMRSESKLMMCCLHRVYASDGKQHGTSDAAPNNAMQPTANSVVFMREARVISRPCARRLMASVMFLPSDAEDAYKLMSGQQL